MIILGDNMDKYKISSDNSDLIVKIDDFEKEDELVLLSKEIEKTKLDDTIDLSKYLDDTITFNKSILDLK